MSDRSEQTGWGAEAVREERVARATVDEIDAMPREHHSVPKPRAHLALGLTDRDDEWVTASAVAGKAEVFVTVDKGLTTLKKPPLNIVAPRGHWELFQRSPKL